MIKKIAAALLAVIFIFPCFVKASFADNTTGNTDLNSISSKYAVLYEANSGSILFDKRAKDVAYPASTTKVLTAIIVLDLCQGNFLLGDIYEYFKNDTWTVPKGYNDREFTLDETIRVEKIETRGSTLNPRISEGEKMNLTDMLYGMMLVSGNDCARALARHFSPDGELGGFAKLMNGYCKELGAVNSTFYVPHGLHVDGSENITTAYDMALITAYALKNETFREIVSTETYVIPATNRNSARELENTNRLIHQKSDDTESYKYQYAIGVKTGDTDAAGRCIIAAAEKGDMLLIAVLFGDYESSRIGSPRYVNSRLLFDYGFDNYSMVYANEFDIPKEIEYEIKNSNLKTTSLKPDLSNVKICINNSSRDEYKTNAKNFTYNISITNSDGVLTAPLKENEIVGKVEYLYNNKVIFKTKLLASVDVAKSNGRATVGVLKENEHSEDIQGYDWIFWLALVCLLLIIIIVLVILFKQPVKRRNSQLRRRKRR